MSDVTLSSIKTPGPRRKAVRLTASDAALAIPAWAGIAYLTGCGGGGGGGWSSATTSNGVGGGSGGYMIRLPMQILGETTMAVTIGASGIGAQSPTTTGGLGGATIVAVGDRSVTLEGGRSGSFGGRAYFGNLSAAINTQSTTPFTGAGDQISPLSCGAAGGSSNFSTGFGAGGASRFGNPGRARSAVVADANGENATGFGSGGSGANGTGIAGNGSPGFVLIEFEEIV